MQAILQTATIAINTALAAAVDLGMNRLVGIVMPSGWDAAAITFQASVDGTTYYDVYSSGGTELNFTVAASRFVNVDPTTLRGWRYVKVRSGTTGVPVNQTAARAVQLVTAPRLA